MPIDLVAVQGLWPFLSRIPGVIALLGRWYFTAERLAGMVYVDLYPRHEPARVDLGPVATFQLHLQLMNLSPFELELDRANFHFSCGGVRVDAHILKKLKVRSGASQSLFISGAIPDGAADQIALVFKGNDISLDGNIEFNCAVRSFPKTVGSLSGIQARVVNEHLRARRTERSDA
jgi:hypothetical protein